MTLKDLIAEFRVAAHDKATPPLWAEADLIRWFNQAEQEACRRSDLLIDSSTTEIVSVSAAADDPWIAYDRRIVDIRRVRASNGVPLAIVSVQDMDMQQDNWEVDEGPTVRGIVTDMETFKLRAVPIPTAEATFTLTVQRLPLNDMTKDAEPEIAPAYHLKLVDWVLYRAYANDDPDTQDLQKAQLAANRFAAEFGPPPSASQETWLRANKGRNLIGGVFA